MKIKSGLSLFAPIVFGFGLSLPVSSVIAETATALTVYKSPSCGCCGKWIEHLEQNGFSSSIEHPLDLQSVKQKYQISSSLASCHTGVSEAGFVFEGHVPARYIQQFLDNPPKDALGLTVPGMPMGSPGMEMGARFTPYQVLLLKADGTTEIFANIETPAQQY
ncbi:DUF411 domain-containing protein [Spongiibacter sp. KMU-158]|uniref:DUF411 domain-containing protein n=1 Tax=Spongiibacter pelagi TaxID=2760804 RepID=A0A927C0R0_9GAMM|nr:DUF411 domain-containing protein [Spongiibacter pelagi]MBD2859124.1 DUF411 domain-containing protein [Spongiibacter pelagi]